MNIKKVSIITCLSGGLFISSTAFSAGDAAAGKAKAATCAGCHGENGISVQDDWPNLAGQKSAYLEIALKAYRNGDRKSELMSSMATGLSDADIADLAAYFSGL